MGKFILQQSVNSEKNTQKEKHYCLKLT